VDDTPVTVNSDGSYKFNTRLTEGVNSFHLEFTDNAGNYADELFEITLDTIAPVIELSSQDTEVHEDSFNLEGLTEPGVDIFINGKRVDVGTRQASGYFNTTLRLSYGVNEIVIEARDGAGNIAEYRHSVVYSLETGTNSAAIGLMILLLVVGLILGILLTRMFFPPAPEEEEMPPEELEELPPEELEDEEIPDELEEAPPDELEELPEEGIEAEDELLEAEEEPLEIDEEVLGDEEAPLEDEAPGDLEDIPPEELEDVPPEELEDMPPEELEEGAPEEPEIAEDEIPKEDLEAEPEPVEEEQPEAEAEEEISEEPESIDEAEPEAPEEEAVPEDEDPRIAKLTQAYEDGKISKELYEKNLAKFREEH